MATLPTITIAGVRFKASSRNGSTLDFPDLPIPNAFLKPVLNSAAPIADSLRRAPS